MEYFTFLLTKQMKSADELVMKCFRTNALFLRYYSPSNIVGPESTTIVRFPLKVAFAFSFFPRCMGNHRHLSGKRRSPEQLCPWRKIDSKRVECIVLSARNCPDKYKYGLTYSILIILAIWFNNNTIIFI